MKALMPFSQNACSTNFSRIGNGAAMSSKVAPEEGEGEGEGPGDPVEPASSSSPPSFGCDRPWSGSGSRSGQGSGYGAKSAGIRKGKKNNWQSKIRKMETGGKQFIRTGATEGTATAVGDVAHMLADHVSFSISWCRFTVSSSKL